MKKKSIIIVSLIIVALTTITLYLNFYKLKPEVSSSTVVEYKTVITDPEELAEFAEKNKQPAPAGYKLEKINILHYTDDREDNFNSTFSPPSLLYEIKNVKRHYSEYRYTYPDYSDVADVTSACKFGGTYISNDAVKMHYKTKIGNVTVSRAVKYDITEKRGIEKKYSTPDFAKDDMKVHLKTYTTYTYTQFDIYNKYTGELKEENAAVSVPNGLLFIQYTYGK